MKALLDENLPAALARALNHLSLVDGHEVFHAMDIAPRGCPDVELFAAAASRGITVHVTQDKHNRKQIERKVIADQGLIVFVLQSSWTSQRFWEKSAHLVRWWPLILQHAERMKPPAVFKVPWKFHGGGRFEQVQLR